MSLPDTPVLIKFFANKIESSRPEWSDYLLEIANVFAQFDGEDFDRESLLDHFRSISARNPYALRDPANFRDEFGAYGTYLGVYHIEPNRDKWKIVLSGAARQYLCTPEPDVEAFCRAQLSLFQYPNGAGASYTTTNHENLAARVQGNVLTDTLNEIRNGLKLVPFRLICRAFLAKLSNTNLDFQSIELRYSEIFALVNDPRTNTNPNPAYQNINAVLSDANCANIPHWLTTNIGKFKRNFHIFEHTGILLRTKNGLILNTKTKNVLIILNEIANTTMFYDGFDRCLIDSPNFTNCVKSVISSPEWGRYYDASNLTAKTLSLLTNDIESLLIQPSKEDASLQAASFPSLSSYNRNTPNKQKSTISSTFIVSNPEITRIKKEKANRDHARLVEMFAAYSRIAGGNPQENLFIDLFVEINNVKYIFEMKSCNSNNMLAQVRKGISQLYEYRYRSGYTDAHLCLVLQSKPIEEWLVNYLINDRNIHVCWLVDDIRLECPTESNEILNPFFPN